MEFIAESSTLEFIAESSTSELRLMGESDSPFSDSLLSDACELSCSVYSSGRDDLSYLKVEKENTVIFAFCGSLDPHVFGSTTTQFGECQINNVGCLEWMKDRNNQLASVHQGALTQFLHIWNSSRVQEEARLEYERGKTVVFTGHSMGGAIASLATLWMLDKQLQPGKPKSVFCITFGFPLIGDEILSRAVRRKGWADQFCHVVLGRDIFSRVLLAPSISVCKPLETLFPYWKRSMQSVRCFMDSTDTAMEEALPLNVDGMTEFVGTVVQNCSAVVNYSSAVNMSPNNPLIAAVKALVKLSPYKPFGHYVFCSRSGGIRIENHFAILPILFYTLQTSDANLEEFILEHVGYGNILPNALQNIVKLNELSDLPLSEAGSIYQDRRITTQLDAFGLGIQVNSHTMVLEWREREHEDDNNAAENHPATITALRDCGLLKFFRIPGMRAQIPLLEHIVHMWDPDQQVFHVGMHTLSIDIEDIYFLTGLSRRGSHVTLTGARRGGRKMSEYVRDHCEPAAERREGKVAIWGVRDITLRTILLTIARMAGSASPHMALQSYFQYALECLEPRVFNWADAVLRNLKKQLTKCRRGGFKQFGYGPLIVSFFCERVPVYQLAGDWRFPGPREPRMLRWCQLMTRHVAGPIVKYDDHFFDWLRNQVVMVEDYAYAGLDFRGDPDLALPEGSQWGNIDVGAHRPAGSSPIQRRGEVIVPVPRHAADYLTVERNLEGLLHDVPDMSLDEVPQDDQRHTVGVPASMGRLLRRVARTLVCYREHH